MASPSHHPPAPSSRSLLLCVAALAAFGFLAPRPAEAQIWVVTGSDGRQRFTSTPEPGAELYMRTRHTRVGIAGGLGGSLFGPEIAAAAAASGVEPALVRAVIAAESGFDPRAVSAKGARGLMQLMPETASDLGVGNVWDPRENIRAGSSHLARLLDRYEEVDLALAAYNAGEGAVDRYGGIPPFRETRDYVKRVLAYYRQYRGPSD